MKGYRVYSQIQQLKEKGFKRAAAARQLGINRRTIERYWDMELEAYESNADRIRRINQLDEYEETILLWLKDYPTMSAAQVCDWLKEHYEAAFSERTVCRYVKNLREKYHLKKEENPRDYAAVPELPMGKQMQVDFGEKWMKNTEGNRVKVYAAVFVLSHSRYKYVQTQSRPYTTTDLVLACHACFRFMGGMPQELVFDQDSIVCVSENCGDIIHTYEFEKLRQECKFSVYMCRAADPESKGQVENAVKYVKYNFLENRIYLDDETLNYCCLQWLERTANAKVHGTTKRIPAEVFTEEREHLRPLCPSPENNKTNIYRTVRKDNTVVYDSNRYSLPLGSYNKEPEVMIEAREGILFILTVIGDPLCEHRISTGRGVLIQNTSHRRDRNGSLDKVLNEVNILLQEKAYDFLEVIRNEKSRYARDQFKLIRTLCEQYGMEAVLMSIRFCQTSRLFSANYVKDYLVHTTKPEPTRVLLPIPVSNRKYHVTTEKRSVSVYAKAGGQR